MTVSAARSLIAVSISVAIALASAVHAANPTSRPADPAIDALVTQLGDRSPAVREAAQTQLARIGRPARVALAAAASSSSPQRRSLARTLLASMPLVDSADSPALRSALGGFQAAPAVAQADHALRLLERGGEVGVEAVSRIVFESADDELIWKLATAMPATDLQKLVDAPAVAAAEPTDPPRLYLIGLARFDRDRTRAIADLDRCLASLKIAPPAARPALARLAELLASDAQSHGDAARELAVRRDAAMLAPTRETMRYLPMDVPSDLFASYLAARVRLRSLEGFDDDLHSLGLGAEDPMAKFIAASIRAITADGAPAAHPEATPHTEIDPAKRPPEDVEAIAHVPNRVWETIDALPPDDAAAAIEILRRGGAYELARVLALRAAVDVDDFNDPSRTMRLARMLMAQMPEKPTADHQRITRQRLRTILFGPHESVRASRLSLEAGGEARGAGDSYFIALRLADARLAIERGDTAATTFALDQLSALSIDESTLAIDAVYLLEQSGRVAEADEIFAENLDNSLELLRAAPGNIGVMNSIAWFSARTGRNLEEAYSLSKRALKRASQSAALADTCAEAAFRLGHAGEAAAMELRATQFDPDQSFMLRQLDRFRSGFAPGDAEQALQSEAWDGLNLP